jgi:hypothetical protein
MKSVGACAALSEPGSSSIKVGASGQADEAAEDAAAPGGFGEVGGDGGIAARLAAAGLAGLRRSFNLLLLSRLRLSGKAEPQTARASAKLKATFTGAVATRLGFALVPEPCDQRALASGGGITEGMVASNPAAAA